MKISLVIPLFNKEYSIENSINSAIKQNHPIDEIIIINDGSTDGSIKSVERFIERNPSVKENIKIINKKNGGVSSARNLGIKISKNELIAFLDADDEWHPNFLEKMVSLIKSHPNASIYSSFYQIKINNDKIIIPHTPITFGFQGYIKNYFHLSKNTYLINSSSVIVRKKALENVGYFPENAILTEDLLVWFKIVKTNNFAHINQNLVQINQVEDKSRIERTNKVPYIISYFSNKKEEYYMLTNEEKNYLFNIHRNHILVSLEKNNKKEASMRINSGITIFGLKGCFLLSLLIFPNFLFVFLKKNRNKIFSHINKLRLRN